MNTTIGDIVLLDSTEQARHRHDDYPVGSTVYTVTDTDGHRAIIRSNDTQRHYFLVHCTALVTIRYKRNFAMRFVISAITDIRDFVSFIVSGDKVADTMLGLLALCILVAVVASFVGGR